MSGFIDIYSIAFLIIAVVVVLRLRNVLGRRTGNERPPFDPYSRRDTAPTAGGDKAADKVISLPPRRPATAGATATDAAPAEARIKTLAPEGSPLSEGLKAVVALDRSFDPAEFLAGAKTAYEMIVTAFAEGDRKTLKQLLSREVFDGFVSAITEREGRGETIEFKFVGIDKADITGASAKGQNAQVTVRFLSKLVSATHDKAGAVIDGDPTHVGDVTDVWTFARDTTSRDPNWKLVATESVE
ncbi:MAG TPA: Tim44/TimA family putative adaptor protein [Bauldia sp.]|nr:Tim44/TimA family putative adaptor protein [Bauldia sp.]